MNLITAAAAIIALPTAGFFVQGLLGGRLWRKGDWLTTGIMGTVLGLSLWVFFSIFGMHDKFAGTHEYTVWFNLGPNHRLHAGLMIDNLTAMMLVVVSVVSFLVHLFSIGYMHGDPRYVRYFAVLQIFTAAMLGLVLSDNLLTLYVSWELMGLSSYLLIGHFFEKKSAADASLKAFMTTRIGDVLMFLGILIIFWHVGSLRYADIFAAVREGTLSGNWQLWAGLLLFGGAVGKSAQFPLHVWLPDAMEGPTPVSALIHAATMVAAGVYLIARTYLLLTPGTFLTIAYVGGFTAIFAATMGIVMDDIKKVLAYSTISQLGYMMLGLGVGGFVLTGYTGGIYHLTSHAFFKACLFLGSGSVIHAVHTQNMSEMGGLWKKMKITCITFVIATLALTGLPPFSGYFTKDTIIAAAVEMALRYPQHWILAAFAICAAFCTSFYMFRLIFLTFAGSPRNQHAHDHAHESGWTMALPLVILAALSIYPIGGGHGNWFWLRNPTPALGEIEQRYGPPTQTASVQGGSGAHEPAAGGLGTAVDLSHVSVMTAPLTTRRSTETGSHEAAGTAAHGEDYAHRAHAIAVASSLTAFALGLLLALLTYVRKVIDPAAVARRFAFLHRLLLNKYYMDDFYMVCVVRPFLALSAFVAGFDKWIIDGLVNLTGYLTRALSWLVGKHDHLVVDGLVNAVADGATDLGKGLSRMQTGRVGNYLMGAVVGVACLAGIVFMVVSRL
jgi:NADH-quinone oxidoreductase subunit L